MPVKDKIFTGWYSYVAVRHLLDVTDEDRHKMYKTLLRLRKEHEGKPYEKNYMVLVKAVIDSEYLSLLRNTNDDTSSIFCSELVALAYQEMGLIGEQSSSKVCSSSSISSFSSPFPPPPPQARRRIQASTFLTSLLMNTSH